MKNKNRAVGLLILGGLAACATAVETNTVVATALPQEAALSFLHATGETYAVTSKFLGDPLKCSFGEDQVEVTKPKILGSGWKTTHTIPYKNAEFRYAVGVPGYGATIEVLDKRRLLPAAYSTKTCYVYDGNKLKSQAEKDKISSQTATALASLGIEKAS